ncbi:sialomucin core protein 24-like [Onthophagus taurus]|uniref:sialomucin core protein 24-like n=1 Tax=Onthophagus taurus TaxID=166361 RepID=UPI000C1FE999|nr:sialomucin core protein 24-like [Onthophagus taurus]
MRAVLLIIGIVLISIGSIKGEPVGMEINNSTDFPTPEAVSTLEPAEGNDTTTTELPTTTTPTTTTTPATTTTSTTTTPSTTISPTPPPPPPSTTGKTTTESPHTTVQPPKERHFDGASFFGGIILAVGLMAIGLVVLKFYKARAERNYHTL